MNYANIYQSLINKAKQRTIEGYSELHHVVPKCMGGSDNPDNLVRLTPEEHYVAHLLLVKMHPDNRKLIFAANMMGGYNPHNGRNNKTHGWLRRKSSIAHKLRCKEDPELRKMRSERMKRLNSENPNIRKESSERMKNMHKLYPDKMKDMYSKMKGVPPWESPASNATTLKIWKDADKYYEKWKLKQEGYCRLGRYFGFVSPNNSLRTMVNKFKDGWNPKEDAGWLGFVNQ
ncbi:putative homing endonuclease [Shigella phage Ag3]|uniref:Putative homing endonuclease n=1 Tax=Shigella phage Ag3 TaxID=637730 RepID=C8XUI9_9CAUD|nr:homing endonuclease [Shigella phage Ag3]ACO94319.1 putative homing endonuclease [Shigella phage Ag3]